MNTTFSPSEFLSEVETKEILDLLLECRNPQDIKDKILSYYKTNKKHRYSFIASYIMSKANKVETNLTNICENLQSLIDNMPKDNNHKYRLEKLYDHINLELVRVNYTKEIKSSLSQSERKIQNIDERNQNIQKELENSRTQYITILGIFASIVITFMAGISFSNAVFSNIGKAPFYQLVL